MNLRIHNTEQQPIAELVSEDTVIRSLTEALDLIGNAYFQGAGDIIISKHHLSVEFFDLSSGLAGDILQKISTYRMRLAIVGDFEQLSSRSLRDFIRESNRVGRIIFVATIEEALSVFQN